MNDPSKKREPGRLAGTVSCAVHTIGGRRLIDGRYKDDQQVIKGLGDFSRRANLVYRMAAGGDPFADYQLVQLEVQIEEADKILRDIEAKLSHDKDAATSRRGRDRMKFSESKSVAPLVYEFQNLSPYAIDALGLILEADKLLCQLLMMEHHNLIRRDDSGRRRQNVVRILRGVLNGGSNYQHTGCTREDLEQQNQVGLSAVKALIASAFLDLENVPGC